MPDRGKCSQKRDKGNQTFSAISEHVPSSVSVSLPCVSLKLKSNSVIYDIQQYHFDSVNLAGFP